MSTILFIGGAYVTSITHLRSIISSNLAHETHEYDDILSNYLDGILTQWLEEGEEKEKELANKIRGIDSSQSNTQIMKELLGILNDEDSPKPNFKPDINKYLTLKKVLCIIGSRQTDITEDKNLWIDTDDDGEQPSFKFVFAVDKVDNESFGLQLIVNQQQVGNNNILKLKNCTIGRDEEVFFQSPLSNKNHYDLMLKCEEETLFAIHISKPFMEAKGCVHLIDLSYKTETGLSAFENCSDIKQIIVDEDSLNYCVEDEVLYSKDKTQLIFVPNRDGVFIIPSSVIEIGRWAFVGCTELKEIAVDKKNSRFCSRKGILYTKDMSKLIAVPGGKESVEIPRYVTEIGVLAFATCTGLTSVVIPSSVTKIGERAFYGCTSLTSIVRSNVIESGCIVFSGCTGLTSIEIPSSVTKIGDSAFSDCTSLTSIVIPSSVTEIGDSAFYDCTSLTSIVIPCSVTVIGAYAFSYCTGLTSIVIPSCVTKIGVRAFSGCTSLTSIEIPSSVTVIGDSAFSGCTSLTSIEIPSSVTKIGDFAFSGCTSLTSIVIPSSVTKIGDSAFSDCTSLTSIVIPCSVTVIGASAFSDCTSLTSIEIPSSVTVIGAYAFFSCNSLTSIEIPSNVMVIGDGAFRFCSSLTSIEIPSSVTEIGDGAFRYCKGLKEIHFKHTTPVVFSDDAFYDSNISKITIFVPKGSGEAYRNHEYYKRFKEVIEE